MFRSNISTEKLECLEETYTEKLGCLEEKLTEKLGCLGGS